MGTAIERIHFLAPRLIKNPVRPLLRADLGGRGERLQIDDAHFGFAAVAGKTATQLGSQGKPMHSGRVGDVAHHRVGIQVHDDDMGAVRDVQPPSLGVDRQVIPTGVAGDRDLLEEVIARVLVGTLRRADGGERADQRQRSDPLTNDAL